MADQTLDATGLRCPEPIMMIRKTLRTMESGKTLYVIADDLSTTWDVPSFCQHMDHLLIASNIEMSPFYYFIQKG